MFYFILLRITYGDQMKIENSSIIGIQRNKQQEQILLKGIKNWFKLGDDVDRDEVFENYKEKKLVSFLVEDNEVQVMMESSEEDEEELSP